MNAGRNEISEAVTLYYGSESKFYQPAGPFPPKLIERFGLEKGRELEQKIKLMVADLPSDEQVMQCADDLAIFNLAKAHLRKKWAELDEQAICDLSNEFSFWWK